MEYQILWQSPTRPKLHNMALAPHTRANREFFEPHAGPSKETWVRWIESGCVKGKVIDGKPFIDMNFFAANDVMKPSQVKRISGMDLLTRKAG